MKFGSAAVCDPMNLKSHCDGLVVNRHQFLSAVAANASIRKGSNDPRFRITVRSLQLQRRNRPSCGTSFRPVFRSMSFFPTGKMPKPLLNTSCRSKVFQFIRSACGPILRASAAQTVGPLGRIRQQNPSHVIESTSDESLCILVIQQAIAVSVKNGWMQSHDVPIREQSKRKHRRSKC